MGDKADRQQNQDLRSTEKERTVLNRRGRWIRILFAIVFNVGMMLLLFHLFDPDFESTDDITIVQFVNGACGSFDPHLVYSNYLMGIVLSTLYRIMPAFPWYSWMQFAALCAAFTAITYVLSCRIRTGAGFALALLVQSFADYEFYIHLQYTKTAGILAAAGMMLLWHGLWGNETMEDLGDEQTGARKTGAKKETASPGRVCPGRILWMSVFIGILLCVWSILYRYAQFAACAVLTAGIPLLMLLDGWKTGNAGKILRRCIPAGVVLGVLLAGLVLFDRAVYMSDPQWKKFVEYNDARSELMDYGMTKYEEHEDLYTELGISRTAYDLFDTWNSGDTVLFSTENMKKLAAAREVKKPGLTTAGAFFGELPKGFLKNRIFRCFLIAAGLWILFGRHDGRAVFALIAEAVLFLALYYYLFLKGRYFFNRVDVGLWISVLVVLLWTWKKEGRQLRMDVLRTVLILAVMGVCAFVQMPGWKGRLASHCAESRERRARVRIKMQEISQDTEHLYMSKIGILSATRFSAPFEPMPQGILSNVVTLGGWKVESVPVNTALEAHGFSDNPYEAIAGTSENAEKVYLVDDDLEATLGFLREYYNPDAEAVEAGQWNGETLWQIVTKADTE